MEYLGFKPNVVPRKIWRKKTYNLYHSVTIFKVITVTESDENRARTNFCTLVSFLPNFVSYSSYRGIIIL